MAHLLYPTSRSQCWLMDLLRRAGSRAQPDYCTRA
jgi:hypothetical protein